MRMLRIAVAVFAFVFVSASARAQQGKRYLVSFRDGATQAERQAALKTLGVRAIEDISDVGALVGEVPADRVTALADDALAVPAVADVEEDVEINWLNAVDAAAAQLPAFNSIREKIPSFIKSDAAAAYPLPAGVDPKEVPWGIARVNAPAEWAKTQGQGVRVAVIDTGIDLNHPDLKANIAGGYNALDSGAPPQDDNGHGSHVAGTIAAVWDGRGVVGVAPKARLYAVKVLNAKGSASLSSIIKGLIWCGKNNMQVANMSLGAPIGSIFMHLAVKYALDHGVAIMAAAGNNGRYVEYPGAYDGVIAVAASDVHDKIAEFSSRGSKVEFIAPGVAIRSTVPGGYDTYSGTSMATPHMTGLAALAIAQGALGPDGVRASLERAARSIGLRRSEEGNGLVDATRTAR